jgi:protein gp37
MLGNPHVGGVDGKPGIRAAVPDPVGQGGRVALMGAKSGIQWCDATFNPWWGCTRVSAGCEHCYAETFAARQGFGWGPQAPRRVFPGKHWNEPLHWNQRAKRLGVPYRVFCASMADVFEDNRQLTEARKRLWGLIEDTEHLTWMLLTKRPENAPGMVPWGEAWPRHVWLGATAENQHRANEIVAQVLGVRAAVHFISAEPLLGSINLQGICSSGVCFNALLPGRYPRLGWVIVGGESGGPPERALVQTGRHQHIVGGPIPLPSPPWAPGDGTVAYQECRQVHVNPEALTWVRSLRDQCQAASVPFFFKQWGGPTPKSGGRLLDGREWNEFPK